jgi:HK97 family phage major capsid protein
MPRTEHELRERLALIDAAIMAAVNLTLRDGANVNAEVTAALADFQADRAATAAELRDNYGPADTDVTHHLEPHANPFGLPHPATAELERVLIAAGAGEPATFGPDQRDGMAAWARKRYPAEHAEPLSLGKYLKGMVTGRWTDAEAEHRAMSEGGATAGQTMVPTPLAASIIDKARNQTRVLQAGALTIPMDSQTLKLARITGDATPAWRSEAAALALSDMTFDSVTLTAQSLSFYVKVSRELVEDATVGGGVDAIISDAFAKVISLELDRAALRGSGTAPEPRGVLNTSGITTTAHGTNGSVIGSPPAAGTMGWEFLVDSIGAVRNNNFQPNAQIMAPRSDQSLAKLRDTTNQYIAPPRYLEGTPRLLTKQVPINLTVGTSTDTSEVYTGDWSQLLVGIRTELVVDVLKEAFMQSAGQYAFYAWLRADVALAQPTAFVVDTGVRS